MNEKVAFFKLDDTSRRLWPGAAPAARAAAKPAARREPAPAPRTRAQAGGRGRGRSRQRPARRSGRSHAGGGRYRHGGRPRLEGILGWRQSAGLRLPRPIKALGTADAQREFAFSKGDFEFLAALGLPACRHLAVRQQAQPGLRPPVAAAAAGARAGNRSRDYREYLDSDKTEIERFINSISTNHTKFFREAHHFTHFRSSVAETFAQQDQKKMMRRLRVWSAGCSTGEEGPTPSRWCCGGGRSPIWPAMT